MKRILKPMRQFLTYLMMTVMIVTMVSQNALSVMAAEQPPAAEEEAEPEQPPAAEEEAEPEQPPAVEEEAEPEQPPAEKEETEPEQPPAEKEETEPEQPSAAEEEAEPEQPSAEEEKAEPEQLPTENEDPAAEIVPGSDLPIDEPDEQEADDVTPLADTEDERQGWVGQVYWSVTNGKLEVTGSGDYRTAVMGTNPPWFNFVKEITTAEIGLSDMTSTSYMFAGCINLTSVKFTSTFDSKNVTSTERMFQNCSSLSGIDLRKLDTSNVEFTSNMFEGCSSLKELDLSGFDLTKVTIASNMFKDCKALQRVDLSGCKAQNLTSVQGLFRNCENLKSVDVSGLYTEKVTNMSDMFSSCRSLTTIQWGDHFQTAAVTNIQSMFSGCSGLTELDLSGFDLSGVKQATNVRYFLSGCSSLQTIHTPYNIDSSLSIALPTQDSWYDEYGGAHTELPHDKASATLTKTKPASAGKETLVARKTKTEYACGETVDVSDLTVLYYGSDGTIREVTDYTTNRSEIDTSVPGKQKLIITYQGLTAEIELTFSYRIEAGTVTVTVPETVYTGIPRTPVPTVKMTVAGKTATLSRGRDFTVSYRNNVNASEAAEVTITGVNDYSGTLDVSFTIRQAQLTIRPLDMTLAVNDKKPESGDFAYRAEGLCGSDVLLKEPSFTCDVTDMSKTGLYTIRYVPGSADAGTNYQITGENGRLTVAQERVSYTVTFDYAGHTAAEDGSTTYELTDIIAGSLIRGRAPQPEAKGYLFAGWYRDRDYKKAWNFETDTVQEDLTLYACWLLDAGQQAAGADLCIQEIAGQAYTGKQSKPTVLVYASGASEPLKAGRDYTVKYGNNVEADKEEERNLGGVGASESDTSGGFTKDLAYVVITGKGNYTGTVYRNFHIEPAPLADAAGSPAKGVTLKYTEQLQVNAKKAQQPFTSLKYQKAMKAGTDYEVRLTALSAYDEAGNVVEADRAVVGETGGSAVLPKIPAGWRGSFLLTVTGKGNYQGTIEKRVYVSDKNQLMKNASVTLGKNLKNAAYTGKDIVLQPAWYDAAAKKYYAVDHEGNVDRSKELAAADAFTVKFGKEYLCYGKDFSVRYADNCAVGKAVMTINGEGDYLGEKSVTFQIKGTAFSTKNVTVDETSFQKTMSYTGNALTQNGVTLKKKEGGVETGALVYGRDYTISYKNNRKKGTAEMTFTAKSASGYTGSFRKTFKITAAELGTAAVVSAPEAAPDALTGQAGSFQLKEAVPYAREGAKLAGRIVVTNKITGDILKEGVDYTVSYANHKAVTAGGEAPVMTIKGRGNYAGVLQVSYQIKEAEWSLEENDSLRAAATPIAFDEKKEDAYAYVPKIKVTDGKATLKAGKDYDVEPYNCTQDKVREYLQALADLRAGASGVTQETVSAMKPYVQLTAKEGSGYRTGTPIRVDLNLYRNKLTGSSLYVVVSEEAAQTTYTGQKVTPSVAVYYGDAAAVRAAKKNKVTAESILTDPQGEYRLTKLQAAADGSGDCTLSYGSNVTAGKNKGSLTVTGTGSYGGSVTVKFTILQKGVYKVTAPV